MTRTEWAIVAFLVFTAVSTGIVTLADFLDGLWEQEVEQSITVDPDDSDLGCTNHMVRVCGNTIVEELEV